MRIIRLIAILVCASFGLCGCVNFANRVLDNEDITEVYQATKTAAGFSYVLTFPQVMSPTGGEHFMWD